MGFSNSAEDSDDEQFFISELIGPDLAVKPVNTLPLVPARDDGNDFVVPRKSIHFRKC